MEKMPIPDMRFEQGFKRALYANARSSSVTAAEKKVARNETEPLPVITPGIVIYTIIKDQMFMPFVQGFAWACILLTLKPWLFQCVRSGRSFGVWAFSGLGLYKKPKMY